MFKGMRKAPMEGLSAFRFRVILRLGLGPKRSNFFQNL
jgi:hypothetical protein